MCVNNVVCVQYVLKIPINRVAVCTVLGDLTKLLGVSLGAGFVAFRAGHAWGIGIQRATWAMYHAAACTGKKN